MSKVAHAYTDDKPSTPLPADAPEGQVDDPSYKTGKNEAVPVIDDNEPVEDPMRPGQADSDKQLGMFRLFCLHLIKQHKGASEANAQQTTEQDEREAIDKSNIIGERTRKKPPKGTFAEPTDEDMGLVEGS
jgi:hypothetical protein